MCKPNVPRETKQIETKDYLVSNEHFILKEFEKGLLKTTPNISDSEIYKYYSSDDYLSHNRTVSFLSLIYTFASKYMLRRKANLISKYIDQGSFFLDFGCGIGELVLKMKSRGFVSHGVENNLNAYNACLKKNISVFKDLKSLKSKFDLISCWHSLEHLSDFAATLSKFNKSINNNGYLIVAVPNHESFDSKYYGKFWAGYDVPRHRFHFSKDALIRNVEDSNFKLVDSSPMFLDAFYISILSEKYKKNFFSFFKGVLIGAVSTFAYLITKNASSHYFVFKKSK